MQLLMIEPKNVRLRIERHPKFGPIWKCSVERPSLAIRLSIDLAMFGHGKTMQAAYLSMFRNMSNQGWGIVVMRPAAIEQTGNSPRARAFSQEK